MLDEIKAQVYQIGGGLIGSLIAAVIVKKIFKW
jgi:hypothetical protein